MRTALPLPTAKSQTEIADLGWIHLASAIAHEAEGDCHPVSHKLLSPASSWLDYFFLSRRSGAAHSEY